MAKTKTYLTYEECQRLLPMKSKRQFRTLTQCSRLYRHANGQSYEVRLTFWSKRVYVNGAWVTQADKEVYSPPLVVVHPHNVAVLDDTAGLEHGIGITVHNLFYKFFGMCGFSKSDRRSTVKFWWYMWRPDQDIRESRAQAKPFAAGIQLDIPAGQVFAGVPEARRRRVNLERAKPLREQIAAWDKFASTYFQMLETWDEPHAKAFAAMRRKTVPFPKLGDEPTVNGLLQVIAAAKQWWSWRLNDPGAKLARAVRSWRPAFEKWKEHIYEEHGAFDWELVDKAA